jgi:hypothetical protein
MDPTYQDLKPQVPHSIFGTGEKKGGGGKREGRKEKGECAGGLWLPVVVNAQRLRNVSFPRIMTSALERKKGLLHLRSPDLGWRKMCLRGLLTLPSRGSFDSTDILSVYELNVGMRFMLTCHLLRSHSLECLC